MSGYDRLEILIGVAIPVPYPNPESLIKCPQ
jgi:hypothetical protein